MFLTLVSERGPGFCIQSSSHISRIPINRIISENNDIILHNDDTET